MARKGFENHAEMMRALQAFLSTHFTQSKYPPSVRTAEIAVLTGEGHAVPVIHFEGIYVATSGLSLVFQGTLEQADLLSWRDRTGL